MQICPACKSSNPDGIDTCERCSSHFGLETPFPEGRSDTPTIAVAFTAPVDTAVTAEFTAAGSATAARQAFSVGLFPGDVVSDRYEIIDHIGEGGMGSVYKALDRELDRIVALKTIRPDLASNAGVLRRFKQEVLLARKVTHQNVIRIHDLGMSGALRFLTMEFFAGEDLCAYLERRKTLEIGEAVAIVRQICEGLRAAHGEGVIHRDLKPQNILIDASGQIRILDFGLARGFEVPGVTHTGLAVGTPDYMAPEQAQGEQATVRSDIYAVGLTFYELLLGEMPFKGETAMARLAQRMHQRPPSPKSVKEEIPQHLDNIVMRCLATDPAERYESVDALLADLDTWEQPQAPSVPHSSEVPVMPTKEARPRSYNKVLGLAAAIIVCGILVGYLYMRSKEPSPSSTEVTTGSLTNNPEAGDLVLKGRNILKNRQDAQDVKVISRALDDFTQARAKDHNYPLAWAGIADANLELYRLKRDSIYADQAKAAAEEAYRLNSKVLEAQLALGSVNAEVETGKRPEAIDMLKQAADRNPKSDEAHLRLGRAYLTMGEGEKAVTQYERAVKLSEYDWYDHDQLARAYWKLGRNDDALKQFNKAAQLNSKNADVHKAMGVMYSRQSRWPQCIEEFQKAARIKPTASIYNNLGTALFYTGHYDQAASMFQEAIKMNPLRDLYFGNLADVYRQSKHWEKAQESYDHAIELASQQLQINSQNAEILGRLAMYYAKKGNSSGAAEAREKIALARSLDSKDNQLMFIEAIVQAISGNKPKAFDAVRKALENGYSAQEILHDPDLAIVRSMPEFNALIKKYRVS